MEEKETGKKERKTSPRKGQSFERYDVSPAHSNSSTFTTEAEVEEESKTLGPGILMVEIFPTVDIPITESPKIIPPVTSPESMAQESNQTESSEAVSNPEPQKETSEKQGKEEQKQIPCDEGEQESSPAPDEPEPTIQEDFSDQEVVEPMEEDRVASPKPKEVEQVASPVPAVPILTTSKFVEEQKAPSTEPNESLESGEDKARSSDLIATELTPVQESEEQKSEEPDKITPTQIEGQKQVSSVEPAQQEIVSNPELQEETTEKQGMEEQKQIQCDERDQESSPAPDEPEPTIQEDFSDQEVVEPIEEDRVASPKPKEVEQVASPVPAVPIFTTSKFVEEQKAPSTEPNESLESGEDKARSSDLIATELTPVEESEEQKTEEPDKITPTQIEGQKQVSSVEPAQQEIVSNPEPQEETTEKQGMEEQKQIQCDEGEQESSPAPDEPEPTIQEDFSDQEVVEPMEEDRVASPKPKEVEQVASPVPAVPILTTSKFVEEQKAPNTEPDESLESGEDKARSSDLIATELTPVEESEGQKSEEPDKIIPTQIEDQKQVSSVEPAQQEIVSNPEPPKETPEKQGMEEQKQIPCDEGEQESSPAPYEPEATIQKTSMTKK